MLKIAICDDDEIFAEKLNQLITETCKCNCIDEKTEIFSDGQLLLKKVNEFHLIFLDIEMPSMDGISVAEKLNQGRTCDIPYIVFVSGYDYLVFKALRSYPYSFIRKKDAEEDLEKCILKVSEKIASRNISVTIRSGRNDIIINARDIVYLEKQKNYVIYHTSGQDYTVRGNIDTEYEKLKCLGFLRPHIGYIVNNEFIMSISAGEIILKDNIFIPISKKYSNVREDYFKWLGEKYV